jgi:hypothetical protein
MDDQWTEISPDEKCSRTFILLGYMSGLWIRRMVLMSLCGVSDLSSVMPDYSDGIWFREMMQLMKPIVMMVLMI